MSSTDEVSSALQASRKMRSSFKSEIALAQKKEAELEKQLLELDEALSRLKLLDGTRTTSMCFADSSDQTDGTDDTAGVKGQEGRVYDPLRWADERKDSGFDEVPEQQAHRTLSRSRTVSDSSINPDMLPMDVLKARYSLSPFNSVIKEDTDDLVADCSSLNKKQKPVNLSTSTQDSAFLDEDSPTGMNHSLHFTQLPDQTCSVLLSPTRHTPSSSGSHTTLDKNPESLSDAKHTSPSDSSDTSLDSKRVSPTDSGQTATVEVKQDEVTDKREEYEDEVTDKEEEYEEVTSESSKLNRTSSLAPDEGFRVSFEEVFDDDTDTDTDPDAPLHVPTPFHLFKTSLSRRESTLSTCSTTSQSKRPIVVTEI